MDRHSLCFLENDSLELSKLGKQIDETLYSDSHSAIIKGRLFAEKLANSIVEKEGQGYLTSLKQVEKIKILNKEGYIDDTIAKSFDIIRTIGNKAVHEGRNNDLEYAIKVHKNMYKLAKWYIETYGKDYTIEVPEYTLPEIQSKEAIISEREIDDKISEKLAEYINKINKNVMIDNQEIVKKNSKLLEQFKIDNFIIEEDEIMQDYEEEIKEDIVVKGELSEVAEEGIAVDSYTYKKSKGSYLLNELEKLSDSAQEAVESFESLDRFKKYLHVKRSIQDELVECLKESYESEESQIILLSGSVGDGKSHLLAYINEEHHDMVKKFNIHNDATESFDPKLTEIETLKKVLNPFSDENIDKSKDKLILAINLGVLHNFLEDDFIKENYKKFANFINKSGIFQQESINNNFKNNNFKLVSFGDYSIYELTEDGPRSYYITDLLKKIVKKDENNPFYNAYKRDIEEMTMSPVIENYKILSIPGVIERISDLIISVMVKYKKLVSTREILNFIYEILVPANIDEFDISSTAMDYNKSLLPNILFRCKERGPLLATISKEDPLKCRKENLDNLLIKLNIATDLNNVLSEYMDGYEIDILKEELADIKNFNSVNEDTKQEIIDTIIRSLYLIGNNEIKKIFQEESYIDFMEYLYHFNKGNLRNYISMFEEVKSAVFKWNGVLMDKYIYLNKSIRNYKVGEYLEFEPTDEVGRCFKSDKKELERFKKNITLGYEMNLTRQYEKVEIDYQLYKKIVDVNKGYCPNKNDKEEAVIFIEFIDKVLTHGDMKKELLIENTKDNNFFRLSYKSITDSFRFERIK